MRSTTRNLERPVTVNGHVVRSATFAVTVREDSDRVVADISFEGKYIGQMDRAFPPGTPVETVLGAVRERLTPEPRRV